jgi:hypothetical protein
VLLFRTASFQLAFLLLGGTSFSLWRFEESDTNFHGLADHFVLTSLESALTGIRLQTL